MKILSINQTGKYVTTNSLRSNHLAVYSKNDGIDTFTASTITAPSFKQAMTPKMMASYATFLAMGFAAMQKFLGSQNDSQEVSNSESEEVNLEDMSNLFGKLFNNDAKLKEEIAEQAKAFEELEKKYFNQQEQLEKQKQISYEREKENQDLKLKLLALTGGKTTENQKLNDIVRIEYPKRRGKLSKEEQELKDTVTLAMPAVPKDVAEAFGDIFYEIINSENKDSRKQLANELNEQLIKANQDQQKIRDIAENFLQHKKQKVEIIENTSTLEETPSNPEDCTDNEKTDEVYRIETPKLNSPKILGSINIEDRKLRKRAAKIEEIAVDKDLYKIILPGTVKNVHEGVKILFKETKKKIKTDNNERINMLYIYPVAYVKPEDVKNEIIRQKEKGSEYKNITIDDSEEIASLLSSGKFSGMFCLHSAMRLIDRYVNFNSPVSLEKQCDIVIKAVEQALMESFKKGLMFKPYKTIRNEKFKDENGNINNKTKEYYSSKVFIDTSALSPEVQDVLGTLAIDITFAIPHPNYAQNNTECIIATIFSEGV